MARMHIRDTWREDDKDLVFVPLIEVTTPPHDLIKHIKDCWWIVHPTKDLVHYKTVHHPQCNRSKEITEGFALAFPRAEVKFIPSVFHRIKPSDYA